MIQLTLPFPPSVNGYWRSIVMGRAARVVISEEGRKYRRRVAALVLASGLVRNHGTLTERLRVRIDVYPPDQRARDLDNLNKSLLDALSHACVWQDDEQVDDLRLIRCGKVPSGKVVVSISPINPEQQGIPWNHQPSALPT